MATENQVSPRQRTAPTFELKRFVWATPDRLELAGTFGGLQDTPVDAAPVLVVRAGDNVHRLPAVADTLDGPPEAGRVWQAAFAWQDAPVAFGVAELHLGSGLETGRIIIHRRAMAVGHETFLGSFEEDHGHPRGL